jgi:histidyl-tRNA synthetase
MSKLDLKPYKGTRDVYPEDMRLRRYVFGVWREVVEACGYEEYGAPCLEPLEIYAAKTGEEIVGQQTYAFTDRGGRQVAIRPEMTPTIARMVAARRQETAYPARLYSIANFMRYEKPQKGREREFWQLNADIFGAETIDADVETIALGAAILERFGATPEMYTIKINDRRLVDFVMGEYLGLDAAAALAMVKLFDRKAKISAESFEEQAVEIITANEPSLRATRSNPANNTGLPRRTSSARNDKRAEYLSRIQQLLAVKTLDDVPSEISASGKLDDIVAVSNKLAMLGVAVEFDITLMRGFDYYTGIVFEVFDNSPENNRSMFGGGRYDGLVGLFGVADLPVVGFAPGETTTVEFLKAWDLVPTLEPTTDLVLVKLADGAEKVAAQLRAAGVRVAVDFTGRKLDKVIKAADKGGVKWALFVGEDELAAQKYQLRNIETGESREAAIAQVVETVTSTRARR